MIPLAFTGRGGLGGVQMRGRDVAAKLGVPFYDAKEIPRGERFGTLVIVKYWPDWIGELRKQCERLILDPLDVWTQTKPDAKPVEFWRWVQGQTGCDAMLATSPACAATMQEAGVKAIEAWHHGDPRIESTWHDPNGPVVYLGGERFIRAELPAISKACQRLGRKLVTRYDRDCWQSLKGAALSLCVRFGAERSQINLWCKPAVKLANAARAGVPVLATSDPAVYTVADVELTTGDWAADIAAAINSPAPDYPHDLGQYVAELREKLA